MTRRVSVAVLAALTLVGSACAKKAPNVTPPPPPGPSAFPSASSPSGAPASTRPPDPPPIGLDSTVRSAPIGTDFAAMSDDALNGPNSPLKPAIFAYDSDELDAEAKKVLAANAEVLAKYRGWVVTIEDTVTNGARPNTIWRWAIDAPSRPGTF